MCPTILAHLRFFKMSDSRIYSCFFCSFTVHLWQKSFLQILQLYMFLICSPHCAHFIFLSIAPWSSLVSLSRLISRHLIVGHLCSISTFLAQKQTPSVFLFTTCAVPKLPFPILYRSSPSSSYLSLYSRRLSSSACWSVEASPSLDIFRMSLWNKSVVMKMALESSYLWTISLACIFLIAQAI